MVLRLKLYGYAAGMYLVHPGRNNPPVGSGGAGERGSGGAGEQGSRGAGEQGSRGAGEQGSKLLL